MVFICLSVCLSVYFQLQVGQGQGQGQGGQGRHPPVVFSYRQGRGRAGRPGQPLRGAGRQFFLGQGRAARAAAAGGWATIFF